MAPNRKKAPARKIAARRTKQRSRRPTPRSNNAAMILKGFNALISYIPGGTFLQNVADFAFKAFGIKRTTTTVSGFTADTVDVYGLGAVFSVTLASIIENTQLLPHHHVTNNPLKTSLFSPFTHGQLLQLRVTARPVGQLSTRQGFWAIGFVPYTSAQSEAYYNNQPSIPTLQDVLLIPGVARGPGTASLSVNYRSRSSNAYLCQPHKLETHIGAVFVSFHDTSRFNGKAFDAEEFGAELCISGAVRLSNPIPHVGYAEIKCEVKDLLADVKIRVNNLSLTTATIKENEDCLTVTHPIKAIEEEEQFGLNEPSGSPRSVSSLLGEACLDTK